ncbi:general substrate transporter [Aspergillus filifer]
MSVQFERRHVSKLVPTDHRVLMPLLLAVTVVNSATLGYDGSVMNGLLILPCFSEYFNLTTATEGLNNAALWIGHVLGAFLMPPIADYIGRRRSITIAVVVTAIGIILQAAAQHIAMFVVARIIIGIGTGLSSGSASTLLGELLPPRRRARVLGLFFSCYFVGSLASSIINYGSQNIQSTWAWRLPSLLQFIPSLLAAICIPFIPESPRWLIGKDRTDEALEVLMVMQGKGNMDSGKARDELNGIRETIVREAVQYPRNPYREFLSTKANRKRLVIVVSFGLMIEMFGNFIISYYLTKILDQAGITNTKTQTQVQVIINCWSFAVAIVGSFMLDIIGRRVQTFIGVGGMVVTLCMIGGLIKRYGESTYTPGIYGTIAVIFLFQGFYAFSVTPMTSLYATEVSPFKLRTTGVAIFRMMDSGFGLVASFAMAYAMEDLGWKFYFINAAWDFVFLVLAYFTFVETKGLTLEEVDTKFESTEVLVGVKSVEGAEDVPSSGKSGDVAYKAREI